MLNKEEIEKILSCDKCPTSYACEGCDITYNDKQKIKKYIQELEESNKQLDIENNRLEKIEFERDTANKVIEEMAIQLVGVTLWNDEKQEPLILINEEEVIKHFKEKVKDKVNENNI